MSNVVNLRKARKRKARAEAEAKAASNRAKFGRTTAEKALDMQKAQKLSRLVDQAKLDKE